MADYALVKNDTLTDIADTVRNTYGISTYLKQKFWQFLCDLMGLDYDEYMEYLESGEITEDDIDAVVKEYEEEFDLATTIEAWIEAGYLPDPNEIADLWASSEVSDYTPDDKYFLTDMPTNVKNALSEAIYYTWESWHWICELCYELAYWDISTTKSQYYEYGYEDGYSAGYSDAEEEYSSEWESAYNQLLAEYESLQSSYDSEQSTHSQEIANYESEIATLTEQISELQTSYNNLLAAYYALGGTDETLSEYLESLEE